MNVKDSIPFHDDNIPESSALNDCAMFFTHPWDDFDADILRYSFLLFTLWEKTHPIPCWQNRRFNLIACHQESFTFEFPATVTGTTATMIFLNMRKVRAFGRLINGFPHPKCLAIVLEELCHSYYMIADEWEVKEYLLPILRQMYPQLRLHHLYSRMFDQEDQRIERP